MTSTWTSCLGSFVEYVETTHRSYDSHKLLVSPGNFISGKQHRLGHPPIPVPPPQGRDIHSPLEDFDIVQLPEDDLAGAFGRGVL